MSQRLPMRVSRDQWNDIKEWYEDHDWTQAEPEDIDFPDDHDRRFDDMYSDRTEIPDGDELEPPF